MGDLNTPLEAATLRHYDLERELKSALRKINEAGDLLNLAHSAQSNGDFHVVVEFVERANRMMNEIKES